MDNFHHFLKKQLLEYVEAERKKGIPLKNIEKVLLDAGHEKNVIDEVFLELEQGKSPEHKDPVEKDMVSQLKGAFSQFMGKASSKEVKSAKKDFEETDTDALIEEVIEEVEIIEEKTTLESIAFFIYLIAVGFVILFSAGATDSQIVSVIIGFLPVILSIFISFLAVKLADNVPLYMALPILISTIFYGVGKFTGFALFQGMDIEGLAIVNFLLAFIFNILIVYIRFLKPDSMKRQIMRRKSRMEEIEELRKEFKM
ncbi:MAG: hypothetical protein AABW92_01660 [Nanoarchaeota archaeon]